jgi:L-ascorbate metabolism protein UlaG (beta-lactamase superfamily)
MFVRRALPLAVATLLALALPARADAPPAARLTWYGQSFFMLESAAGTRIAMDPFGGGLGYPVPQGLRADAVTVSHEHPDHNNVALLSGAGKPKVIRGLTADRKGWVKIDERVKDVSVRSVGAYHDDDEGRKRGLDTIFVFEVGGLRIVHLGDLGHVLTDQQLTDIGSVDVLLVPVGGAFTIDGQQANRVVDQLRPRLVVVPMHYKTQASSVRELDGVDTFLAGRAHVRRETGDSLAITGVKKRPWAETVVLGPP